MESELASYNAEASQGAKEITCLFRLETCRYELSSIPDEQSKSSSRFHDYPSGAYLPRDHLQSASEEWCYLAMRNFSLAYHFSFTMSVYSRLDAQLWRR